MASTALFLNTAIGQSLNEVRDAGAALKAPLLGLETGFSAAWEPLEVLVAARDFPARQDSVRQPVKVVQEAIEQSPHG